MSQPKVYTVNGPSSTSASSLPSWITVKPKSQKLSNGQRKRVKTQRQLGQLELVQDFAFPESAIRIKTTEDGNYAIATGCYKPMIKVWDLNELTVKFERVTDAENVDFVILSSDWTKQLHLQRDRSLALHTQSGLHHSVRLPTYGRTLAYHSPSAEAYIACTGTEVFRFNLEEGRYMTPINIGKGLDRTTYDEVEGVNVIDVNPRHGLLSMGLDGGGGIIEFWDPRSRTALTRLTLPTSELLPIQPLEQNPFTPQQKLSITALSSHPSDGLSLAVGTSTGHTLLYDLRSPSPYAVKDQGYGEPMRTVEWLRGGGAQEDNGRVVSADSKVIKIWDKNNPSENHLSLHPANPLLQLHPVQNSGLMFAACDASAMSTYYIPEIGPAPRWAGFLENVTEELADDVSGGPGKGAYSDFKFVDKDELETLGLTHLIGSSALKPYMHGYFLSLKLYTTARLIANPTSYAEHRDKIVSKRLAEKAESRIRARKEQPKVNKALAERLRKAEEREEALAKRKREKKGLAAAEAEEGDQDEEDDVEEGKKAKKSSVSVLQDPRFKEIFENPEFEVDEESREFALINPATANINAKRKTAVQDEDDESDKSSSGIGESESEDDAADDQDENSDSDDSDTGDLGQYDPRNMRPLAGMTSNQDKAGPSRHPQLVSVKHPRMSHGDSFGQRLHQSRDKQTAKSKGKDHSLENDPSVLAMKRSADGGMEMSFIPTKSKGRRGDDIDDQDEYSGGSRRQDRGGKANGKIEKFGAGLEKGEIEKDVKEQDRSGRDRRRQVGRSASKNAFRKR